MRCICCALSREVSSASLALFVSRSGLIFRQFSKQVIHVINVSGLNLAEKRPVVA